MVKKAKKREDCGFTSKELDEETGLYYFGARYYDAQISKWMSPDPIYDGVKEGFGVYTYCKNNPLIYKDPTGLESADAAYSRYIIIEENKIKARKATQESLKKALEKIKKNMAEYNQNHLDYTTGDMAPDTEISQSFANKLKRYKLLDGTYLSYLHSGIDRKGKGSIKAKVYMEVIKKMTTKDGHIYGISFSVIGTDRVINIEHPDESVLKSIAIGTIFEPDQVIFNYPTTNNYPAISGGIHLHFEELIGGKVANPDTHKVAPKGTEFYYRKEKLNDDGTYSIIKEFNLYKN